MIRYLDLLDEVAACFKPVGTFASPESSKALRDNSNPQPPDVAIANEKPALLWLKRRCTAQSDHHRGYIVDASGQKAHWLVYSDSRVTPATS